MSGASNGGASSTPSMRLAYADPPYPGKAHLYPENTEVDHAELIEKLCEYDGWALSTWEPALADVLPLAPRGTRVLAWCRPNEFPFHASPSRSWEPVLLHPARPCVGVRSYLEAGAPHGFLQKNGVTGQKPRAFCDWIIRCLGADPDDTLDDIFPGTGIMGEAWGAFTRQLSLPIAPRKQNPLHKKREIREMHGSGLLEGVA